MKRIKLLLRNTTETFLSFNLQQMEQQDGLNDGFEQAEM